MTEVKTSIILSFKGQLASLLKQLPQNCRSDFYILCKMASSGMLRRVALVGTEVSKERSASIIMVTRISEISTTLAVTSNRRTLQRNTTNNNTNTNSHRRENLKSYIALPAGLCSREVICFL
jgi:hypothetical protein